LAADSRYDPRRLPLAWLAASSDHPSCIDRLDIFADEASAATIRPKEVGKGAAGEGQVGGLGTRRAAPAIARQPLRDSG